jgi:hypothetical protein
MWPWKKKTNMDAAALAATPCNIDLTGHWTARLLSPSGDILFGVRLEQYGTAVFGTMQCKFAADAPCVIRGIVVGNRLIANHWRPDGYRMGSGMLDLTVAADSATAHGTSNWYSIGDEPPDTIEWTWQKNVGNSN